MSGLVPVLGEKEKQMLTRTRRIAERREADVVYILKKTVLLTLQSKLIY
jgi:hypothetical protein